MQMGINRRSLLKFLGIGAIATPVLTKVAEASAPPPKLYPHQEEALQSLRHKYMPKWKFKNVTVLQIRSVGAKVAGGPMIWMQEHHGMSILRRQALEQGYHGLRLVLSKSSPEPSPTVRYGCACIVRHVSGNSYEVIKHRDGQQSTAHSRVMIHLG